LSGPPLLSFLLPSGPFITIPFLITSFLLLPLPISSPNPPSTSFPLYSFVPMPSSLRHVVQSYFLSSHFCFHRFLGLYFSTSFSILFPFLYLPFFLSSFLSLSFPLPFPSLFSSFLVSFPLYFSFFSLLSPASPFLSPSFPLRFPFVSPSFLFFIVSSTFPLPFKLPSFPPGASSHSLSSYTVF